MPDFKGTYLTYFVFRSLYVCFELLYLPFQSREINIKNLVLDPDNFPPYVPENKFRVEALFKENNRKMLSLVVRGRIESKKKSVFKNKN